MFRALLALFALLMISVCAAAYWANYWWNVETVSLSAPIDLEIKEGATIHGVSNDLFKKGLITKDPKLFHWGWRIVLPKATLKAGDYKFEGKLTPAKIAHILASGQTITISFTIPEGWNMYQIAEKLESVFPAKRKPDWLKLMTDKKLSDQLPGKPSTVEGFLFPDTYTFNPKSAPIDVLSTMIQTFKKNFSDDLVAAGERLNLKPIEIVTLASIIEKETGKEEERPHISSVFHNRMRIGMRLQTDPTVIYGIWERYDGNIRRDDLKTPTPYNTYVIPGLPPGPIASPGRAALKAAVEPIKTDDLYFVSRGDGSHIFSKNLRDHQKGVYQYQIQPARNRSVRN
ncbi:MAG: endolytic transglycosylase MltG [Silvanigrellaceae bacterium]